MSIIDTFYKYGYNYIISNKKADTVLSKLKDFINRNGKSNAGIRIMQRNLLTNYLMNIVKLIKLKLSEVYSFDDIIQTYFFI